jgi:hypothetical protein
MFAAYREAQLLGVEVEGVVLKLIACSMTNGAQPGSPTRSPWIPRHVTRTWRISARWSTRSQRSRGQFAPKLQ